MRTIPTLARSRPTLLSLVVLAAVAASTLALPLLSPARAAAQVQPADRPAISVNGEGRVLVTPDIARVVVGTEVSNQSLAAAQAEAATRMDGVLNLLKGAGIDPKDIRTVQYTIQPLFHFEERTQRRISDGYQVTHLVQVTIRDLASLGQRLDEITNAGATVVHGVQFDLSDPEAAVRQAREQAVADARGRAEQLARLTGVTLGPPLRISEAGGPVTPQPRALPAGEAPDSRAAPPTPIEPGQNEVRLSVHIEFAIQ